MDIAERISREYFEAFEAVRTSGVVNMFDPRARDLANEMNDLSINRNDWLLMMSEYGTLKATYHEVW